MKVNSEVRYASHPEDAKRYDTAQLRKNYLIENVFTADELNVVYSMHDRMIAGGVMPVNEVVELKPIDILRNEYFLGRREIGIFNVGGKGVVKAGDKEYTLEYKEAPKLATIPLLILAVGVVLSGVLAQPLMQVIATAAAAIL